MSDPIVEFQNWIAQFPSWMVAGAIGFVVVVLVIVFWKALKIALTALLVAVVVAGAWFVWERISGSGAEEPEPTMPPTYLTEPAPASEPAPAPATPPALAPAPAP